ncbi:MAG: AmmeMemoRadiSam system protein A [Acidobacteriota bacterium]
MLNVDQQKELLRIARKTIDLHLKEKKRFIYSTEDEALRRNSGAFVSIHRGGQLRGCIGNIFPVKPLYETVIDCAISAATEDYRFEPLSLEELAESSLEISVLSYPELVRDINEIIIGKHGLIITQEYCKGLLLPQVATEYHWDRETFLTHTCIKAGLPRDAWKKGAKIEKFSAEVFSEEELKG